MDFRELLGRQQPLRHHGAVDQFGSQVLGGRDEVAAAEPGAAQAHLPRSFPQFITANRQKRGGVKVERVRPRRTRSGWRRGGRREEGCVFHRSCAAEKFAKPIKKAHGGSVSVICLNEGPLTPPRVVGTSVPAY